MRLRKERQNLEDARLHETNESALGARAVFVLFRARGYQGGLEWRTRVSSSSKRTGATSSHGSPSICRSRISSTDLAMHIAKARERRLQETEGTPGEEIGRSQEAPIRPALSPRRVVAGSRSG